MDTNTTLSPLETTRLTQCQKALTLMAEGKTQRKACELAGISVRQFKYWVQKEGGMEQLTEIVQESAVDALIKVVQSYASAMDRLVSIATSPGVRAQDQIAAIKEMRVMLNEVINPAANRSRNLQEGTELPAAPVPFTANFMGNTKVSISPEIQQVIDQVANQSSPASPTASPEQTSPPS